MAVRTERFTVTADHLKLLRAACIGWDDTEFGAPAIDCKRPYGNSDVYGDMAEILGIKWSDDEDERFTIAEQERMERLHRELKTVLQIAVRVGRFEAAEYESDPYPHNWRPAAETGEAA